MIRPKISASNFSKLGLDIIELIETAYPELTEGFNTKLSVEDNFVDELYFSLDKLFDVESEGGN